VPKMAAQAPEIPDLAEQSLCIWMAKIKLHLNYKQSTQHSFDTIQLYSAIFTNIQLYSAIN
jgi:hypothetical protein